MTSYATELMWQLDVIQITGCPEIDTRLFYHQQLIKYLNLCHDLFTIVVLIQSYTMPRAL